MPIGRLKPVPIRQLWRHEAHDFTVWLGQNLNFLGEVLNLELSLVERETMVGSFFCDILAEDSRGNYVVIENQLEASDHDHLGKLITYLSNLEAKTAIWVVTNPRPEHEQAIHWLNEVAPSDVSFYLVHLQAFQIGESLPAPHLTVVAGATPQAKEVGTQKKELAERHTERREFWAQLLAKAAPRTSLHHRISPSMDSWLAVSVGNGLTFSYIIRQQDAQVRCNIDTGDYDSTKRYFDRLFGHKIAIEQAFGGSLEWSRQEQYRTSRIEFTASQYGLKDKEQWDVVQEQMIEAMIKLHSAFEPHIGKLQG